MQKQLQLKMEKNDYFENLVNGTYAQNLKKGILIIPIKYSPKITINIPDMKFSCFLKSKNMSLKKINRGTHDYKDKRKT